MALKCPGGCASRTAARSESSPTRGYLEGSISERLLAARFDAILLKPASFDEIIEAIERLTQGRVQDMN